MRKLIFQIIVAILGIWLATTFVPGVQVKLFLDSSFFGFSLTADWQIFLLLGIILGLLNFFVKPILDAITLPLRIITLGLFSFVINMVLIWFIDFMFREFSTPLVYPLLWTTLIVWTLNVVLSILNKSDTNY